MKKNTVAMSLQSGKTVRGYEIKRQPLGKFVEAMGKFENAPLQILQAVFPNFGTAEILAELQDFNGDKLLELMGRAFMTIPEVALGLFCEMAELDKDKIWNDTELGLDGLLELFEAWVEVNGIINFMKGAQAVAIKLQAARRSLTQNTGYKG